MHCAYSSERTQCKVMIIGMNNKKILVLNGPNLNLLGKREPGIYGNDSMESAFAALQEHFPEVQLDYYQSNVEGELINKLHEVGFSYYLCTRFLISY